MQRFTEIYQKHLWGGVSVSGEGSDPDNTRVIKQELPRICKQYNIRSIIDVPVGDYNWMSQIGLTGIDYIGVDVVEELIDANKKKYPNVKFLCKDLTQWMGMPKTDIIICRDCLVHLSIEDINKALDNIYLSGSKYLLATTFTGDRPLRDIITGGWRPLNMERDFRLGIATEIINEEYYLPEWNDKSLGLWLLNRY